MDESRNQRLIDLWRLILKPGRSWVLFEQGTCVVCTDPEQDPREYAIDLMKNWGPVHPGSSAGDFNPVTYNDPPGVLVGYHHPDILTFVPEDEMEDPDSEFHLGIGLVARHKRDEDARNLRIVHVEEYR
ncbi:MAG: hypothetical protein RTU92_03320 [Candidatus Thorarchaeota archaeon]